MSRGVLPGFMNRDLDSVAHNVYREPFLEKSSRKQINQWPNQVPIGNEPASVAKAVADYNAWASRNRNSAPLSVRIAGCFKPT